VAEPSVSEESFLSIACSNKESLFCDEKRLGTSKKKQEATRDTSRIKATHESRALTPPITIMLDLLALLLPRSVEEDLAQEYSRLYCLFPEFMVVQFGLLMKSIVVEEGTRVWTYYLSFQDRRDFVNMSLD
jgi:hypothetical protein